MVGSIGILGVATTGYSRVATRSALDLFASAVAGAVADAGLNLGDVDGLVVEGAVLPGFLRVSDLSLGAGITPSLEVATGVCAAGLVGAPRVVRGALRAGDVSFVAVANVMGGSDRAGDPYSYHAADPFKAAHEIPAGWYGQASYFAAMASVYEARYGPVAPGLQRWVEDSRRFAQAVPDAQVHEEVGPGWYAASPLVAEPLRKADCCQVSHGATAYVVGLCSKAIGPWPAVEILGSATSRTRLSESDWFTQRPDLLATGAEHSASQAFQEAGIGAGDVSFAQLYDCFSITPMLQLEEMGLAPRGKAATQAAEGTFGPAGRLPVNTNGGLLSYGFCLGITHVVEAVRLLRGERSMPNGVPAEVGVVGGLGVPYHSTLVLGTHP